ncbi:N-acetylglucosamine-6-phosphate deacetylase [Paenibacillus solanacearum]|uniref:N-acetylglucosamine-6-phosphate deacetylase n=1 Tax=Paenibacillus solanacearum TaxID=2048548 RepID=A0A916K8W7_9BACL|nr:N-acetylglucosamine-6-phosphate deacetylase [Paenibacillus solanacearum]CAG7650927.1 N-acetylglucosamine-6-phosphate deacetylase [Paenibacillus solanacearum]
MRINSIITNAKVVTPHRTIERGFIALRDGRIRLVGPMETISQLDLAAAMERIDVKGSWALPGFVDVHVHGGFGHDFMDASQAAIEGITRFHASCGTTTMLATTVTGSKEALADVLQASDAFIRNGNGMPYARLAGVHLEGPFISPKWPGAQNPSYIVPPQPDWIREWTAKYPGLIKLMTLAPETEGALETIRLLSEQGIVPACGHTDSTYAQIVSAAAHGLRHAVHTFNAMKGLHHREPGVVGAVMTEDRITAEVIADGHHVHPACIGLLAKAKGPDGLVLVTDAISAAGLGDGDYQLGGLGVIVKDGVARLKEGDSLAGSTLTMIEALRFMVQTVGVSMETASRMASGNPARQLGMEIETGSIETGKLGDLVIVSPDFKVERVMVAGRTLSFEPPAAE